MNIPVLIPAYNPDLKLLSIVTDLVNMGFEKIIVVNDGSSQEYKPIFNKLLDINQCRVLEHAVNLGKGAALKTGFNYVLVTWPEAETVITADADGQHAPGDIFQVCQTSIQLPGALVTGVREFHRDIPLRSLIGNSLTRLVFRLFTGLKITDTQTGLRAWPRTLCMEALKIDLNGYDLEMESLVRAKHKLGNKFKIVEVPIKTIYEEDNKSSHFNPILDSMRIYFVFFRYSGAAIVNALVDNFIFMISFYQTHNIGLSQVAGRMSAMLIAFVLARNIVFNSSGNWHWPLLKFVLLVIVMGGVSYGTIDFLHTNFRVNVIPAKLMTEGLMFLANFAVQRDFIFSKKEEPKAS